MNVKRLLLLWVSLLVIISLITPVAGTEKSIPVVKIPDSKFTQVYPKAYPKPILPIDDTNGTFTHSEHKPLVRLPVSPVIVVSVPKIKTTPKVKQNFTSGIATYYCLTGVSRCTVGHSGGMYAAIRRDLLYLRGKVVQVCRFGTTTCIKVTIIDCNCGPNANLIDLYSDAFKKLSPLSGGIIKVWLRF